MNLTEILKEYNIFADFGNADLFNLSDFIVDEEHKKITFKGKQDQMTWVKIDALHPIKLSNKN